MAFDEELLAKLRAGGYELTEVAPGVIEARRRETHTTMVDTRARHIHYHYLTSDEDAEANNDETLAEICCHGCATGMRVRAYLPPQGSTIEDEGDPVAIELREEFVEAHKDCKMELPAIVRRVMTADVFRDPGGFMCPSERKTVYTVDIRAKQKEVWGK